MRFGSVRCGAVQCGAAWFACDPASEPGSMVELLRSSRRFGRVNFCCRICFFFLCYDDVLSKKSAVSSLYVRYGVKADAKEALCPKLRASAFHLACLRFCAACFFVSASVCALFFFLDWNARANLPAWSYCVSRAQYRLCLVGSIL